MKAKAKRDQELFTNQKEYLKTEAEVRAAAAPAVVHSTYCTSFVRVRVCTAVQRVHAAYTKCNNVLHCLTPFLITFMTAPARTLKLPAPYCGKAEHTSRSPPT